jgi:hypothetical protein
MVRHKRKDKGEEELGRKGGAKAREGQNTDLRVGCMKGSTGHLHSLIIISINRVT